MAKYSCTNKREYQKTQGLPPRFLDILWSFWGNIQPSPELNSRYRHSLLFFGCHHCYKRLHLVDCVVARSATKLGGLGACPHSREAKINVQYPPIGVILYIWNTTKYPVPFLSIVALKNRLCEMANQGGWGRKSWKFCERCPLIRLKIPVHETMWLKHMKCQIMMSDNINMVARLPIIMPKLDN